MFEKCYCFVSLKYVSKNTILIYHSLLITISTPLFPLHDSFSDEKQRRFESHFGKFIESFFTLKFVDFIPIRFNYIEIFDMTAHEILAQKLKSPVRVVLNHFTMLRCHGTESYGWKVETTGLTVST